MATTSKTGSTPAKKTTKATKDAAGSAATAVKAKAPAKKAPAKAAAPKAAKAASPKATPKILTTEAKAVRIAADRRRHYIEVAAYYIAERRGFIGGSAADDWKAAEVEIDRLLAEGRLNG